MFELGKRSIGNFFEHRMATYAEQLSYRGRFGVFPFIILVFAVLAVLRVDAVFDRLIEAAMGAPQYIPEPLEPIAEEGRAQAEFLRPLIEQAREQAGGELLSFGIVVPLWSISAVAFTMTEVLNAAYGAEETRSRRKRFACALALGPFIALAVIVVCGLMLIGLRLHAFSLFINLQHSIVPPLYGRGQRFKSPRLHVNEANRRTEDASMCEIRKLLQTSADTRIIARNYS